MRNNIVWQSAVVGVVLNVVLALALTPFASQAQKTPPNGAANLSLVDQFMHMIVHHKQVLFMSSLIVFIVVLLSVSITLTLRERFPRLS